MGKIKDLAGKQFDRLLVLSPTARRSGSAVVWRCLCSCGNALEVRSNSLTSGNTKSCGCLHKEVVCDLGKAMGLTWGGKNIRDVSGTIINGIQVLRMSDKRTTDGKAYCFAMCPICHKDWEITVGCLKRSRASMCRRCYYKQRTSKTADSLLDKLEKLLSIKIIREYKVENKYFDGYIPDLKILIESDGSYWHSDKQDNDLAKDQIAKTAGLQLIRVVNNYPTDHERALQEIKEALLV